MSTRQRFPSDEQDQFMLRFSDGMRTAIKERAATNGRSMNSEILMMLAAALEGSADQRLARIEAKLDQALSTAQPSQRSA